MENLLTYIESGILELYALDQLSTTERAEVEMMLSKHPELQQELALIEQNFEDFSAQNAVEPSAKAFDQLMSKLEFADEEEQPKVIQFTPTNEKLIPITEVKRKVRSYQYGIAACMGLLIVSLVALVSSYSELKNVNNQLVLANASKTELAVKAAKFEWSNDGLQNAMAMIQDPTWKNIVLTSQKNNANTKMLLCWNPKTHEVVLNCASMNLPNVNDEKEDFQLWAIVNGKPQSLGVFSSEDMNGNAVMNMQKTANATAFAVTVEPKGGSINPTLDKMVASGAISS